MKGDLKFQVNAPNHNRFYGPKIFVFSGGEVSVQIENLRHPIYPSVIDVHARIMDSEMLMALVHLVDALRNKFGDVFMNLHLGYIPYARQDRICNQGENLAIKSFARIINSMNFNKVIVLDAHSDVSPALFDADQVHIKSPEIVLSKFDNLMRTNTGQTKDIVLVSPDYGATKKVQKVSKYYGGMPVVQGTKERDLQTGRLTGFDLYGDVNGKNCLIVDDICDGGGTFLGLVKVLKERGANKVELYVSHGIFSKGVGILLDNGIDNIYTTDSFKTDYDHPRLKVVSWE